MQYLTFGILITGVLLTGCQNVPTIEKSDGNQVIQQEFTQSAIALTNELNTYNEIEELFIEDEADNALDLQVRHYLEQNPEIKKHQLKIESLDLKIFKSEAESLFYLAVFADEKGNPNTIFGSLAKEKGGTYTVCGEHIGAYAVNTPKTYLMEKDGEWVVVSQRPFSTFEECYFFKMENGVMKLFQRGWQDMSLLYYSTITELLQQGKIEEAMALPDSSMYPMGYEQALFETANLMVTVSEQKAAEKENANDMNTAIGYLEWSLNYYFQNHYGLDIDGMVKDLFSPIHEANADDFGGHYVLEEKELKKVLLHYANLLGKSGNEKGAESLKKAVDRAFKE